MEEAPDGQPRRPRRKWERVVAPAHAIPWHARETFRRDAPSPSEEVLARHDADLAEQARAATEDDGIIRF